MAGMSRPSRYRSLRIKLVARGMRSRLYARVKGTSKPPICLHEMDREEDSWIGVGMGRRSAAMSARKPPREAMVSRTCIHFGRKTGGMP